MNQKLGYHPNPDCRACRGAGWVYPAFESGITDFTRVIHCAAPGCMADSYAAYRGTPANIKAHGVSSAGITHTFDNFKPVRGVTECISAFVALAEGDTDKPFLLCYGGTGNGKTHLVEAAVSRLIKRGIDTRYFTVANLLSVLHESISDNSTDAKINELSIIPGLALDDWGVEYGSEWELSKLETIIDNRYGEHRITILTSNKDIRQMELKSQRILSRFSDENVSVVVLNKATDYRRK